MLARESAYVHVAFCVTEFQLTIDRDAVRQAAANHFNERFQRRAANQSRCPLRLSSSFLPPPPSVYVTSPFLPSSLHVRDCVYPPHSMSSHASRIFEIEGRDRASTRGREEFVGRKTSSKVLADFLNRDSKSRSFKRSSPRGEDEEEEKGLKLEPPRSNERFGKT